MLKYSEFMPYAPEVLGDRVRINHDSGGCSGNSKSMLIVRKDDGSVYAKCFRCGQWGCNKHAKLRPSLFKKAAVTPRGIDMPADASVDWDDFDVRAKKYLFSHHFTETVTREHGIAWSKSMDRLIFPIRNKGKYLGYQAKSFTGSPKYITRTNTPDTMYYHHPVLNDTVLIVEDMLSGIRGSQLLSTFALLGTELTPPKLVELSKYNSFILWLDNDNSIVKTKQLEIYNRLNLFGKTKIIKESREVKELTINQIKKVINYK